LERSAAQVLLGSFNLLIVHHIKYDKQDHQGKAALNERSPTRPSNKSQWQGALEDPKQKQETSLLAPPCCYKRDSVNKVNTRKVKF
jgi:hypothetical protein